MSKTIMSVAAMAMAMAAMAQTSDLPVLRHVPAPSSGSHILGLSDNCLWGVGQTSGDDATYSAPRLLDIAAGSLIDLFAEGQESAYGEACDATDDGSMVAGSWDNEPAIYYSAEGAWQKLPMPAGKKYIYGKASAISADGSLAVGYAYNMDGMGWVEFSVAWDLSGDAPEIIDISLPDFDLEGEKAMQVRLLDITNDKKYIVGQVNFSYPQTSWSFLYNTDSNTWKPLGYEYDGSKLIPTGSGLGIGEICFSENGKYAAVAIGGDDEGGLGFYDVETGAVTAIPDSPGKMLGAIDNNGVVYASAPTMPMRNWSFYVDGYWYDWKLALKQLYGIDWQNDFTKEDYGLSGTVMGVSGDGLRIVSGEYSGIPGGTYIVELPKSFKELSKELDPLANQAYYPVEGSSFSSVRNVIVYFDRDIEVVGDRDSVLLLDDNGEEVKSSMSVAVESGQTRNLLITFRNAVMEPGRTYTVVIPEGTVQISGDAERKNKEIRINYVGRPDEAVKPVKISPESGTAISQLSMSTNPVIIEFDAVLSAIEDSENKNGAKLYRILSDGSTEFLYNLNATIDGSRMIVYPVSEQKLAKDVEYRVVVEPNTVGDIAGNNGNELIEITYVGTFENLVKPVDGVVYKEDFDLGLSGMMLFDGDRRTPQSAMANWGFKSEYSWWYVRDTDESLDQSAVSHSMYVPTGKSDDWMVTPRLFIPDASCVLTFDSQSYKMNKEDVLKVYILATDDIYTAPITEVFINRFKNEAELVYSEIQSPGLSEELLAGDWTANKIALEKYAGRYIYIAFVNDNENQSAIFIDNVIVQRDLKFTIGLDVPDYVENQESLPVSVVMTVLGDETYDSASLRLLDSEGNVVDEADFTSLSLKKDDVLNHTFSKELALVMGAVNNYSIEATLGDETVLLSSSVKNLRFKPQRTVVIEEGTGTQCGFCPLGHRALELMEEIYGDLVIPVAIHSYSGGSTFMTSWTQEYGAFLGFSAFPTAVLNRETAGSPFAVSGNEYVMNDPENGSTWFDMTSKMLSELTDAEISIEKAEINTDSGNVDMSVKMRYAYDTDNANLNLFTVVLEDGLMSAQSNNLATNTSTILGEWGAGGKYGKPMTPYTFSHVARGMDGNYFTGAPGRFPREIDSAQEYESSYSFAIPTALTNNENADVVVMLVDGNSAKIINAAKVRCKVVGAGVGSISDADNATGAVYSVTGAKILDNATIDDVNRLEKGIYIFNGKKVMVR